MINRIRNFLAIAFLIWVVGGYVAVNLIDAHERAAQPPTTCQEDDPCFNWRTMGNHQRGIVTKSSGRVTVHASGFCAALRAHDIDWRRTKPLKGDPGCGRS